jgi:hypothetical protein
VPAPPRRLLKTRDDGAKAAAGVTLVFPVAAATPTTAVALNITAKSRRLGDVRQPDGREQRHDCHRRSSHSHRKPLLRDDDDDEELRRTGTTDCPRVLAVTGR